MQKTNSGQNISVCFAVALYNIHLISCCLVTCLANPPAQRSSLPVLVTIIFINNQISPQLYLLWLPSLWKGVKDLPFYGLISRCILLLGIVWTWLCRNKEGVSHFPCSFFFWKSESNSLTWVPMSSFFLLHIPCCIMTFNYLSFLLAFN